MCCRPRAKTEGALPEAFVPCEDLRSCEDAAGDDDCAVNVFDLGCRKDMFDDDDLVSLCSWTTDNGEWESMFVSSHVSADTASECSCACDGSSDSPTCANASPSQVPVFSGCVSPLILPCPESLTSQGVSCSSVPVCYLPMVMPMVPACAFRDGYADKDISQECHGSAASSCSCKPIPSLQQIGDFPMEADATPIATNSSSLGCDQDDTRTTLILRNIPVHCSRDMLLDILVSLGFHGAIDFIHTPVEFRTMTGLGYAVLNMVSNADAMRGFKRLTGFDQWPTCCGLRCEVGWNEPTQGVAALIDRYRSSPLMHSSLPEHIRPALFVGGVRVAFPAPTCRIRPPRIRRNKRN